MFEAGIKTDCRDFVVIVLATGSVFGTLRDGLTYIFVLRKP